MSTTDFLKKVRSLAISLAHDSLATTVKFYGNIALPTVYLKRDVVNVKLKRVQIETSDGIGVGRQLKIRIVGIQEVRESGRGGDEVSHRSENGTAGGGSNSASPDRLHQ